MDSFQRKLDAVCEKQKSLLCIGLDPQMNLMPSEMTDVVKFNKEIVDATSDLVCAYKPNLAFYEALGIAGMDYLRNTLEYIRLQAPKVLIIGDAKRGDVGNTAEAYAKAMFEVWGFDATTVNAYGGHDTIHPFLEYTDKGVFVWCRSSNPSAGDFQDLRIRENKQGKFIYEHIALTAQKWNVNNNIGLVVGSTYPQELEVIRKLCSEMPILIPGVGTQRGELVDSVLNGMDRFGRRAIISTSRQVLYASRDRDFAQAARKKAMTLRNQINSILESEGKGWS